MGLITVLFKVVTVVTNNYYNVVYITYNIFG